MIKLFGILAPNEPPRTGPAIREPGAAPFVSKNLRYKAAESTRTQAGVAVLKAADAAT